MQSQFVLFVAFAFIGCALSAAVDSAPKNLEAAPLNANPEQRNDLLVASEQSQVQPEAVEGDLDSSATQYRSSRSAYYGGYGGYGGYGYGYPSYGYGHHRGYYSSYPSYGGYYGGYYPRHGYGGYGGYGYGGHGYSGWGHGHGHW